MAYRWRKVGKKKIILNTIITSDGKDGKKKKSNKVIFYYQPEMTGCKQVWSICIGTYSCALGAVKLPRLIKK